MRPLLKTNSNIIKASFRPTREFRQTCVLTHYGNVDVLMEFPATSRHSDLIIEPAIKTSD